MPKVKTKELLEKLDKKIDQVKNSKEFKEMLQFFAKFHKYSYQNTILIQLQKPDATYVAGYRQWQKKFNRHVKKGEKGIAILAPFTYKKKVTEKEKIENENGELVEREVEKTIKKIYYKPVYVFDISQTEGEPVPTMDISIADNCSEILKPLREFTLRQGIKLNFKPLSEGLYGYSAGGKIVIDSQANETEKASILIHELAHELLHDRAVKEKLTKEVKEMEAEAIAYVVMYHFGIEIKSDKYLALYKKSYDLKESLERINKVSSRIISFCELWFKEEEITKER